MEVLFRKEALEARKNKIEGDVFLVNSLSFYAITALLVFIVISVGAFLVFGGFARTELVLGYLQPSAGIVKISSSRRGVLGNL